MVKDVVVKDGQASSGVQSVERAFELLEVLADAGGELSLSQIAASSALPMPTIHRIVRTLVNRGYVRQLPSRRYALGPRLINLGESASGMLGDWARPWLTDLVESLGETANLSMLDGDHATYVAQVPSRHSMRMFTEVGRRVHLHCTGVGKALLAQLDDTRVLELLHSGGMPAQTPHTITEPGLLLEQIRDDRVRGYAVDDGEQEIGVRCVAVPVAGGPSAIAISVSGPTARMTPELIERAVPLLHKAATGLTADLSAEGRTAQATP
jgi:IclR family transcriptional regulator, acetate operon repressor